MIPGNHYTAFIADSESKSESPPTLPTYQYAGSLYSAILEELKHLLRAEAVALVKLSSARNEINFELGLGEWARFAGRHIALDRELSFLVTMPGELPLIEKLFIPPSAGFSDICGSLHYIYHTPLIFGGLHMGAIWSGHRSRIDGDGFPLLTSIGDVVANSLYSNRSEKLGQLDTTETIQTLVKKLANWDASTFNHSLRMVPWAKSTAHRLGCNEREIRTICWATLFHDIGKLSVPKTILYKPSTLTADEWSIMRLHPSVGARMVSSVRKINETRDIISTHHEKYDGTGYPFGLNNRSIPLGARILAVVDAYGAMTEERAYKKTYNHREAVEEIKACTGSHFDPEVSQAFLKQFRI